MKAACGRVFKYGDNVDTDVIIPARYLIITRVVAHMSLLFIFIKNLKKLKKLYANS